MDHSEELNKSSEKYKTQEKKTLKTQAKKIKVSENPLGLLAENASKKKAGLGATHSGVFLPLVYSL